MDTPAADARLQVTARPLRSARYAWIAMGVVIVLFVVIAVVMPSANAGATFGPKDQVGTGVLGLLIAAGFWLVTRPRMVADSESVRARSYVGNYRTIPWSVIVDVQFPSNTRFARLVLPGDETLALYAVQRLDREQAVETMRGLRALLAATRRIS
jgi:Bacterial PH domain